MATNAVVELSRSIASLSPEEKGELLELLWREVILDPDRFESPAWHKDELEAASRAVGQGTGRFVDWAQAKKRLLQTGE